MRVKFQFWKHTGSKFSLLVFLVPCICFELYRCPKVQPGFTAWFRLSLLVWTFRIKITNQD